MNAPFVPFTIAPAADAGTPAFTAKAIPQPQADCSPALTHSAAADCTAHVDLVKEGERITTIRLHCSCGAVHELQCVY
jgi:hypothetical protein